MISGGVTQVIIDVVAKLTDQVSGPAQQGQRNIDRFEQSIDRTRRQLGTLGKTRTQVNLEAKDKATQVINKITAGIKSFSGRTFAFGVKILDYATRPLRGILNFLTGIQGVVAALIGGMAVKNLIVAPTQFADQLTNIQIGFESMLGSTRAAEKMMADVKEMARITPFETMDLAASTQRMLAMGWEADQVLKDLMTIGDASAALGKGSEGIDRISLALGQMRMKGKVSAEELLQLTEAGIDARRYIAEGLSTDLPGLSDMLSKGLVDANTGVDLIMKGMEKNFSGMMEKNATRTLSGLWGQIKDTFDISIFEKWGRGLQKGALTGLQRFTAYLDKNEVTIEKWGVSLERLGEKISTSVVDKLTQAGNKLQGVFDSERFQQADGAWDKFKIVWDEMIAQPFDDWWQTKGKAWIAEKAEGIGSGIGSGLKWGLLGILGIDLEGALDTGASIGKSFATGFLSGLDAKTVLSAIGRELSTLAPGGDAPSTGGIISASVLAFMFRKPIGKLVTKGGGALLGKIFGTGGKTAATTATGAAEAVAATTAAAATSIPIYGPTGEVLSNVTRGVTSAADDVIVNAGRTSGLLSKAGKALKYIGPALAGFTSGLTIATASEAERPRETIGELGSWGGMAGGAALGSLIAPGVGTAIGGLIGAIGGEALLEWLYDTAGPALNTFFTDFFAMTDEAGRKFGEWATERYEKYGKYEYTGPTLQSTLLNEEWMANRRELARPNHNEGIPSLPELLFKGIGYSNAALEDTFFSGDWWGEKFAEMADNGNVAMHDNGPTMREQFSDTLFSGDWWREKFAEMADNGNVAMYDTGPTMREQFSDTLFSGDWWREKFAEMADNGNVAMHDTGPTMREQFSDTLFSGDWWREKFAEMGENGKYSMSEKAQEMADSFKGIFANTVFDSNWWSEKWGAVKAWASNAFSDADKFAEENRQAGAAAYAATHARGGIMRRPHLGIVAEDGPESIIPLRQSRRASALNLWAQTGRMLGVRPYAEGGIAGAAAAAPAGGIHVDVGGIHFSISGGSQNLLDGIREHAEEIKNEICLILNDALTESFENMPQQI